MSLDHEIRSDEEVASQERSSFIRKYAKWWCGIALILMALALWWPRFSGPIDLRWDGGVYYLVATSNRLAARPWLRETMAFLLAAASFLLRTAGLALLAAWVFEALVRRRWRSALLRGALGLMPLLLWQAHVMRVRAGQEYAHPAYAYQRAPYQYYNVSYTENIGLIDPFRPELGRISPASLA